MLAPLPAGGAALHFNTYLGGSATDAAAALARDSQGNLVVAGATASSNFPVTAGAWQTSMQSASTAGFIARLDPTGSHILSATFVTFPGASDTTLTAVALDASGNVLVAGYTASGGFVAGLSPALDKLLFNTAFSAYPLAMALDSAANIYVTGAAYGNLQTTPGVAQTASGGGSCADTPTGSGPCSDAFVLKLSANGATVLYATYLGGSDEDTGRAIAIDANGNVTITGDTASANFPLLNAAQTTFGGAIQSFGSPDYGDAFVARFDPSAHLLYSTYLGGAGIDIGYAVALDPSGNAYIGGYTESADFPVTPGAYQTVYGGSGDGFVTKVSPLGAFLWSSFLGGSAMDSISALVLDSLGNIYTTGSTGSADFPTTGGSLPTCRTGTGPFAAELDPTGASLQRSTKGPGMGFDDPYAIAIDTSGGVYLAGSAASQVFFATAGAAQTTYGGGASDAFAMKIDWNAAPGSYVACVLNAASLQPGNQSFFPLGTVAPGEIVSLFGTGLAGAQVSFDGLPAPVLYSSANQVNAVVPYGVPGPNTQMAAGAAFAVTMPVATAVPAIFTYASGIDQAVVINQDGTLNSVGNPATRGTIVTFYAEGAGLMMPAMADGSLAPLAPPFPVPALPIGVTIRGANATVEYAGAAPGFISGLLQINVQVPTSINFGSDVPLFLTVGAFSSQLGVTMAVQ
jgi:uncharacterized protein (TIGR03437 family)